MRNKSNKHYLVLLSTFKKGEENLRGTRTRVNGIPQIQAPYMPFYDAGLGDQMRKGEVDVKRCTCRYYSAF